MKLETRLSTLRRLARVRHEENLDFRAYLKELPFSSRTIDKATHHALGQVTSRIDCTQCANCCREKQPLLGPRDIMRLARATGLTAARFRTRYLKPAPGKIKGLIFRKRPCPFLKHNVCTVYAVRPADCRSYPHLDRPDFVQRTGQAIANYGDCPIVFNVYEILKTKLARRIRQQKM